MATGESTTSSYALAGSCWKGRNGWDERVAWIGVKLTFLTHFLLTKYNFGKSQVVKTFGRNGEGKGEGEESWVEIWSQNVWMSFWYFVGTFNTISFVFYQRSKIFAADSGKTFWSRFRVWKTQMLSCSISCLALRDQHPRCQHLHWICKTNPFCGHFSIDAGHDSKSPWLSDWGFFIVLLFFLTRVIMISRWFTLISSHFHSTQIFSNHWVEELTLIQLRLRIEQEDHQSALSKVKRLEDELRLQKTVRELEFHQTQDSQRGGRWEFGNTTETTFDLWETKRWTWWNFYINRDVRNEENWQCGDSCIAHAFGDLQAFCRLHCLINRELMTHQWVPENPIRFGILSTWRVFWLIPGSLGKIIKHYPKFFVFHPGWSNYPLIKLCRASLRHGITDFIPQWSWLRRSQQNFVPSDAPTTASLTSKKSIRMRLMK